MRKKCLDRWGVEQKIFTFINEEENVNTGVKTALSCTSAEQASSQDVSRKSLHADLNHSKRDHILKFIAVILQKTVMEKGKILIWLEW